MDRAGSGEEAPVAMAGAGAVQQITPVMRVMVERMEAMAGLAIMEVELDREPSSPPHRP